MACMPRSCATVADAMIAKLLTPERLMVLLKDGSADAGDGPPLKLPALGSVSLGFGDAIARLSFVQPVRLKVRVSPIGDDDGHTAIELHFEGMRWRLSGIELPPRLVRDLAARLPAR